MTHMPIMKEGPHADGSTAAVEAVWGKRSLRFDGEMSGRQRQQRIADLGRKQLEHFPPVRLLTPAEHAKVADIFGAALMRHRDRGRASHKNGGAP
jgi:hypothetical protein